MLMLSFTYSSQNLCPKFVFLSLVLCLGVPSIGFAQDETSETTENATSDAQPQASKEDFERLSFLLQQPPSADIWKDILLTLEYWPKGNLDKAIEQTETGLASWPAHLRVLPKRWKPFAKTSKHTALFKVTRHIDIQVIRPRTTGWLRSLKEDKFKSITRISLPVEGGFGQMMNTSPSMLPPNLASLSVGGANSGHLKKLQAWKSRTQIKTMHFIGASDSGLAALIKGKHLQHLESLSVRSRSSMSETLTAITTEDTFSDLKKLNLKNTPVSQESFTALFAAKHLQSLTHLNVSRSGVTDVTLTTLVEKQAFPGLKRLELSYNKFGAVGAIALSKATHLTGLKYLGLMRCDVQGGAIALAKSKATHKLNELDLRKNDITAKQFAQFVKVSKFENLKKLNLEENRLSAKGLKAIAKSGNLVTLRELNVGSNGIGDSGLKALAKATLPKLKILQMRDNRIGDKGLKALLKSSFAKNLVFLNLERNKVSAKGIKALGALPSENSLWGLDLDINRLGDRGIKTLLKQSNLKRLERLDLNQNQISENGFIAIGTPSNLPSLRYLTLSGNKPSLKSLTSIASSKLLEQVVLLELDEETTGDEGYEELKKSAHFSKIEWH